MDWPYSLLARRICLATPNDIGEKHEGSTLPSLTLSLEAFCQTNVSQVITHVSDSEFKDVMDSLRGAVIIDFFGAGSEPSIQALDRNKAYLLYCASGGRSGKTANLMAEWGFKKVYNLEQGYNGWAKQKMPVSPKVSYAP